MDREAGGPGTWQNARTVSEGSRGVGPLCVGLFFGQFQSPYHPYMASSTMTQCMHAARDWVMHTRLCLRLLWMLKYIVALQLWLSFKPNHGVKHKCMLFMEKWPSKMVYISSVIKIKITYLSRRKYLQPALQAPALKPIHHIPIVFNLWFILGSIREVQNLEVMYCWRPKENPQWV